MSRRKVLCCAAMVVAVALAVSTIMYPTWLTDYSFRAPWGDSMTWLRLWPLVCLALVLILVIVAAVCWPEPGEPKTKVLKRTSAPS